MAKKRKSEDVGDSGHAKTARVSQSQVVRHRGASSQESDMEEQEGDWTRRSGMISEVKMTNFMCHETFTFNPNQRLTFLSGENGSGKSAVLTAITFALGGNARVANRGNTNKAFIRTGQNSAKVEVKLVNDGEDSYKPEVYGDSIRICRTVTQYASTYKIMNDKGKPVIERKQKEELERILMAFNIQVDNPIAVLNQDTAKTFLFKCDPEKLYKFFMKATQLDACLQDYSAANGEKEQTENLLEDKKKSLPALQREYNKWEKKYQFQLNLNNKKKDVIRKKAELAWAIVRDYEQEKDEVTEKLNVSKSKVDMCDGKMKAEIAKEKDLIVTKKQTEKEIQDLMQNEGVAKKKLDDLKAEALRKSKLTTEVKNSWLDMKRRHDTCVRDTNDIQKQVDNLKIRGTAEYEEGHKRRMDHIRKMQENIANIESQVHTTENHLTHLTANARDAETKLHELRAVKTRETGLRNKIQNDIDQLSRRNKSKLSAYGPNIENAVNEINRNARRFKQKPIGPLGLYIKIKEKTPEAIVRALDHEMRNLLTGFLVSCGDDQRELFQVFNRCRMDRKPTVYTCPFTDRPHNIQNNRVYTDKFDVLIDYLEIEDVNVFNRVIDDCKLERILFIATTQEAQQNLSRQELVPRNTLYASVANKYYYYPAPNYKSYHYEERLSGLLRASVEEYIADLKQRVENLVVKERGLEQSIKEANDERIMHQREVDSSSNKVRGLKQKIQSLNQDIVMIRNEDANHMPPDISALEEDVEKRKEEIARMAQMIVEKQAKYEESQAVSDAAKEEFTNYREEMNTKFENSEPLNAQLQEIEIKIKSARKNKDYYLGKKSDYENNIKELETKISGVEESLVDYMGKAMNWSKERIDSRKKVDNLRREIKVTEDTLKQQEQTQESRHVVTDNYQKYKSSYDKADQQIKYMTNTLAFLQNMLDSRKKGFKEIRNSTCKNINGNFTTQLNVRSYAGKLDFDHRNEMLNIQVNPNTKEGSAALDIDRDIRNLSGGEKSYSSVSLILALWESMTPPFRVLDEFDVFMDSLNRKIAIDNILNFARMTRKYQFVFLTPLGTENIDTSDDVKIIKLSKAK